jgi:hypothetical protein
MNKQILMHLDEIMPLVKESLSVGQSIRIFPYGTSMLPMLREGVDSVVLSTIQEPKKYDVILYQRRNGQYVLHRLVGVGEKYTFLGDNQFALEHGIDRDQMIAYVSSFYRGDREVSVKKASYKLYCRLWYGSRGIRSFWRRGIGWMRRKFKK